MTTRKTCEDVALVMSRADLPDQRFRRQPCLRPTWLPGRYALPGPIHRFKHCSRAGVTNAESLELRDACRRVRLR
jgi:hypothetical protein